MRRITALPLLVITIAACAGIGLADDTQLVHVGTSGDYAPFSLREHDDDVQTARFGGFDPAVAEAWAHARGFSVRFVEFRWPDLLTDLGADRFDVAMSGVTVRAERSLAGRFSVPVATSGALALVAEQAGIPSLRDLDRPEIRIAVNAGGHLERVARATFPHARISAVADNRTLPQRLDDGRADAVVTDSLEAPLWLAARPGLRVIGPFTRDRKAYLLGPDDSELAMDLDAWLIESEADGTLARLRAQHLGTPTDAPGPAAPLPALLAAIDERLGLMPWVAEAKRRSGTPIEAPDREATVIEAAVRGVAEAATARAEAAPDERAREPDPDAVRRLFEVQIEAAKDVQRRVLGEEPPAGAPAPPDLEQALRPALIRIGQRIAFLLAALPIDLRRAEVRSAVQEELGAHGLRPERLDEIADALWSVAVSRAPSLHVPGQAPGR
jgi:cyclohexadienyl dehydratase